MVISSIEVLYLCDQKQCEHCSSEFGMCKHTSNREHSINYKDTNGPTVDDLNDPLKFELHEIGQQYASNNIYVSYDVQCWELDANETND